MFCSLSVCCRGMSVSCVVCPVFVVRPLFCLFHVLIGIVLFFRISGRSSYVLNLRRLHYV